MNRRPQKASKPALKRILWLAPLVITVNAVAAQDALSVERQNELTYMLKQDCGSCHGLTFKGGLGPALFPDNLAKRSEVDIQQIILYGVPGTPMPPWRPMLSDAEALWMAKVLKAGELVK